jgi:hypothetical protein
VEKSVKGETEVFTPVTDLMPNTEHIATVKANMTSGPTHIGKHEYTWRFRTGNHHRTTLPAVVSVVPLNSATAVPLNSLITVTFDKELTPQLKNLTTVILKKGTSAVEGSLTFAGKTATFRPAVSLSANTVYSGQVKSKMQSNDEDDEFDNSEKTFTWSFTTGVAQGTDVTAPSVSSVVPANNATAVITSSKYSVTFNEPMNPATITSATIMLKQGTVAVAGTVTYAGTTATFVPSAALVANTLYTGTVTTGVKDVAGNSLAANFSSGFTTASANDLTAPTVLSVAPLNNAVSVPTNSKITVTFSEAMNTGTINTTTFVLKQGTASVAGAVTYTGNTATFTPANALSANTAYSANITTGAKDAAGNALAANFSWTFTTASLADVTAPKVLSSAPAANATSVAVNSKATVTFSEAMNPATITSATFTVKQGSTAVNGTVTYTGTTATFTPSSSLAGNTVYTGTITTGVKDVAGNALAASYSWSFTTIATVTGLSFAADVVPVLGLCNDCHTHQWTTSTTASTFYTNLANAGYVNSTSPTSGKIYTKLNGGHPGGTSISATDKNKVLTWITQGSKNN